MEYWTLILTVIIGGTIVYLWRSMTYFKRHGILHKTPLPFIGNMAPVMLRQQHMIEYASNYSKNWPDAKYVGFYMFRKPAIIIKDIELLKSITVKDFDSFHDHDVFINEETDPILAKGLFSLKGSKWRETRAILSPAFTANRMRQMFELMSVCARNFAEFIFDKAGQPDNDIDVKDAFSKYTVDVIATCAFGISINSLKNPNNEFYLLGKNALKITVKQNIALMISRTFPILNKVFNLSMFDSKLTKFFYNIVTDTVTTRKKEGIVRPDMLQLMIESGDKNNKIQLDFVDMTSQAFLFFLGGFETSSSLMAYAAIELAKNVDMQNKIIEQVDEIMKASNGNPSYEAINSMSYLEAFLFETLRYYPIAGFMDRMCTQDYELPPSLPGHKTYKLKAGDVVWFPSYRIHTDPEHYDDPDKFDPERFLGQKMNPNIPTFLGFGIGPRSCIGNRFALLENKLVLFYLLTKCRLEISPKLKQPITYTKNSFIALVEGGFWVKIVPRT